MAAVALPTRAHLPNLETVERAAVLAAIVAVATRERRRERSNGKIHNTLEESLLSIRETRQRKKVFKVYKVANCVLSKRKAPLESKVLTQTKKIVCWHEWNPLLQPCRLQSLYSVLFRLSYLQIFLSLDT